MTPALQYYIFFADLSQLSLCLAEYCGVSRSAELFNPHYGEAKVRNATDVERISDETLKDAMVIQSLKDELPAYIVRVNDFTPEVERCLPGASLLVICRTKLVLVRPLSAAAERVFSELVSMFVGQ